VFDVNNGGSHSGDSVLKFNQGNGVMNLVDYFTPYNQQFLQIHGAKSGPVDISASVSGVSPVVFEEAVLGGPAAAINIESGKNQTVKHGSAAPKLLQVIVSDKYGNPAPDISATYSDGGANGSFSPDPAVTNPKGIAGTRYTVPATPGTVIVSASVAGVGSVQFTANVD
jgi:hypothetical protein